MLKNTRNINLEWLKKNHQMIHYFGLGFIQLKIDDTYRLHFYTKELPPIIEEEDIHNHRYNFTSKVLKGVFEQSLFKTIEGTTHFLEKENCQPQRPLTEDEPVECGIELIAKCRFPKGSEYYLTADIFHRVKADDCITLLRREPKTKDLADVVRIKDRPKICAFSKQIPEKELWEIVSNCLA